MKRVYHELPDTLQRIRPACTTVNTPDAARNTMTKLPTAKHTIEVGTSQGLVRGIRDGSTGTAVFRGIPYAAPPVGNLRFAAPRRQQNWRAPLDATGTGTAPLQLASPFAGLFGDPDIDQSEFCLTLNIWVPPASEGPHPVLVWIPGGSYLTGSASLPRYSGAELAAREGVAVVVVNYRLGVLGFLAPDYAEPARLTGEGASLDFGEQEYVTNAGLLDQIAALRWIHEEIDAFHGDPDRITVVGQSAGGHSLAALLGSRRVRPLFRRAGLVSAPLGMPPLSRETAEATAQEFRAAAGAHGCLKEIPADQVLAAQRHILAKPRGVGSVLPPFQLVSDGGLVSEDLGTEQADPADMSGMELMIGTNKDECALWFADDHKVRNLSRQELLDSFISRFGANGKEVYDTYVSSAEVPNNHRWNVFQELYTDQFFGVPNQVFGSMLHRLGAHPYLYRFDWEVPGRFARLGACHCADIPFLLGSDEARNAPLFADASAPEMARLRAKVRRFWGEFVRTGTPAADWPSYTAETPSIQLIGGTRDGQHAASFPKYGRFGVWPTGQPATTSVREESGSSA
jgi:para-nitrobenzyl esterase